MPDIQDQHRTEGFPLALVIAEVKREIATAQNTAGLRAGLSLESVEITLAIARISDAAGKVTIGVPMFGAEAGGGAGRKSEESSSLYVKLTPPAALSIMSGTDARDLGIARAILDTRRELQEGMEDEPKLEPAKVRIELKFVVTRSGGPKGEVKFLVFSAGAGLTWSNADTSSILLTFVPDAAP